MFVLPQASQNFADRRLRKVMRATTGIMKRKVCDGESIAQTNPTNKMAVPIVKGGHTLRFSLAFLLKEKNAAENRQRTIQTPKKIGKMSLWEFLSTGLLL